MFKIRIVGKKETIEGDIYSYTVKTRKGEWIRYYEIKRIDDYYVLEELDELLKNKQNQDRFSLKHFSQQGFLDLVKEYSNNERYRWTKIN